MQKISALMIVKNEGEYLERALNSLAWCDEIVVVDSGSTDRTAAICRQPQSAWSSKIKFLEQPWLGFSEQRNFTLKQASYDWVFFLDGDEACSPALAKEMQTLLAAPSGPTPHLYRIRRQEYFLKKPIHHSIWNPSYPTRFFNRHRVRFVNEVHENVESQDTVAWIHSPIFHVEDLRIERFLNKLNSYTTLQAKIDVERGMTTGVFKILFAFPAMFIKNYFYYRGYRDGYEGFIISVLEGISRTVRHLKIWQLRKIHEQSKK
jgi:glycosyltransferase involved in cell wall biosynthesis